MNRYEGNSHVIGTEYAVFSALNLQCNQDEPDNGVARSAMDTK